MLTQFNLPDWPVAFGGPAGQGKYRCQADDFIVNEQLGFQPSGNGEHVFLDLEKTGENTEFVARALARFANVRQRDIGFAGLKDRHAITRQWFSVWLPGKIDLDWQQCATDNIKILSVIRHNKKLKRGVLAGNQFVLTIRDWFGDIDHTHEILESIATLGLPNYYGEQRFGISGQNINQALLMFQGAKVKRQQRSLYLSAARSLMFNEILAERVMQKNWNTYLPGDALMFDRSRSYFKTNDTDDTLEHRVSQGEIHPSGTLYGLGEPEVSNLAQAIEQNIFAQYPELVDGLLSAKVAQDRRALRVKVDNLQWHFSTTSKLVLSFALPAGSYATSLLREIIK